MGQHAWLLSATVLTELLIIVKFSRGQFEEPFPVPVKIFFATASVLLISYPTLKVILNYPTLWCSDITQRLCFG